MPLGMVGSPTMNKPPMTKEEAQARIQTEVYKATALFERLEMDKRILGNGHHIRQKIAEFAASLVAERWNDRS